MTELSEHLTGDQRIGAPADRVALDRAGGLLELERQLDRVRTRPSSGAVDPAVFAEVLATEFDRLQHGGADSMLAVISLSDVAGIRRRLGDGCSFDLITEVTKIVCAVLSLHDLYNISEDGEIVVLARDTRFADDIERIDSLCAAIAERQFRAADESVRLTPSAGIALLSGGSSPVDVLHHAKSAREVAATNVGRRVEHPTPSPTAEMVGEGDDHRTPWLRVLARRLRMPAQVVATLVLCLAVSMLTYSGSDVIVGFDHAYAVYVLAGTVTLAASMLAGGAIAGRRLRRSGSPRSTSGQSADAGNAGVGAASRQQFAPRRFNRPPASEAAVNDNAGPPQARHPSPRATELDSVAMNVPDVEASRRRLQTSSQGREIGAGAINRTPPVAPSAAVPSPVSSIAPGESCRAEVTLPRRSPSAGNSIAPGESCRAEVTLPRRSPGASLGGHKRATALSEHARLALRPGQSGGVLVRSAPEVFVREYERSTRTTLAALQEARRSLDDPSQKSGAFRPG